MARPLARLSAVGLCAALAWPITASAQRALMPSKSESSSTATNAQGPSSAPAGTELSAALRREITDLVRAHPSFDGFQVDVTVPRPNRPMPDCSSPLGMRLDSARPWGAAGVTLSCPSPKWSMSIPVTTRVFGTSVQLAKNLPSGAKLTTEDLKLVSGEVTRLPAGFISSLEMAENRVINRAMSAGNLLTLNNFRVAAVIKRKEVVRVLVIGKGFQATGEAVAMGPGGIGDLIQVRMPDGQLVSVEVTGPGAVRLKLD